MLNFKNVSLITAALIIVLIVADFIYSVPAWCYLVVGAVYAFCLFYGSYFIRSGFYIKAICNGNSKLSQVALTFDDGPAGDRTGRILDILKENQIEAAFFCIGKNIDADPASVNRIINEKHLIGNHSKSHHFFFDLFPKKRIISEIQSTNLSIHKITGLNTKYFRPPYGVTTPVVAAAIKKTGMTTIGWSFRSYDTLINDEHKLISKVASEVKAGDILLFHDSIDVTVKALPQIITAIQQKGMEIVRLDKLINQPAYV